MYCRGRGGRCRCRRQFAECIAGGGIIDARRGVDVRICIDWFFWSWSMDRDGMGMVRGEW